MAEITRINVSGQIFTILTQTLSEFPKGSVVHTALFGNFSCTRDEQGLPFFECDPKAFEHILCLVRTGSFPCTLRNKEVAHTLEQAKTLCIDVPHIVCGQKYIAVPLEAHQKFETHIQNVHGFWKDVRDFVRYMQHIEKDNVSTVLFMNNYSNVCEIAKLFGCRRYFCKYPISNSSSLVDRHTYVQKKFSLPNSGGSRFEDIMFFRCVFAEKAQFVGCHFCECEFTGKMDIIRSVFENCIFAKDVDIVTIEGNRSEKVNFFYWCR